MCIDGNMKCVVDSNSAKVFNVQNFCINEPLWIKEYCNPESITKQMLSINLLNVFKHASDYEIKILNTQTGEDIKQIFADKENIIRSEYKIRLLYKGLEIKGTDLLSMHNFDKHPQIQVAYSKIEENE